jgi:dipeptidyl aminopeptidase/acylaminoacyl peptidase
MRLIATVLACVLSAGSHAGAQVKAPTVDELISLRRAGSPVISPSGKWVAYTIRETNWEENTYETEIWLADAQTGATRQLTNGRKSSNAPAWSPDGRKLAFGSDREDKRQIYLIDLGGGEALKLTSAEESVGAFAWSPDGRSIAFASSDQRSEALKDREKKYAEFDVIDEDHRMSHLYVVDVETKKIRRLTSGAFTAGRFDWSPDSRQIAFDHRINGDPANGGSADISIVGVSDGAVRTLVTGDGPDSNPQWSPDGSQIAFETSMASPKFFFTNRRIATVPAAGGPIVNLSAQFDEDPSIVRWTTSGIFFSAASRAWAYLYRLDPATKTVTRLAPSEQWIGSGFSLSADAQTVAFMASDATTFPEIYVAPIAPAARERVTALSRRERNARAAALGGGAPSAVREVASREHQEVLTPKRLTTTADQVAAWPSAPIEVVSWPSQDGAIIEGILHKPVGFQAGKRYPLLVVIHGGPTGVSRATPYGSTAIYPIDLWVAKGALVLEPNYRGSAGYGEKFRSLNYRNLGVGDAWDVVSGVDYLVKQGLADAGRVGTMGWSQGGYISAFLATHDSARFKAVSVGAGISNWMTYYVNTDIHPFTRQYLNATPWDDPEIYAKTSPMTYIKSAQAPTLIQHGATDQRVPLPNAFELYQGLQDVGVPTKLIVYKGFEGIGHGPSKPKSSRALMEHNLEWFEKYLFGAPAARERAGVGPRER